MGADACVAFYGLRFEVRPQEESALEDRTDHRVVAARRAGLNHWWGNTETDGQHYLFIGRKLAILGYENAMRADMPSDELRQVMDSTADMLRQVGFQASPSLVLQWEPDY